ncbi:MAG: sugar phosphate isomerase/epimerase [Chthoniobacteraceae bacterium]
MKKEQLAINSVSTKGDFEETLGAYREAGFRKVEFALWQVKEYMAKGHTPVDVRALLDRCELQCIGGFAAAIECFSDDVKANHDMHVENAKLLSVLGGTNMVVGTDGPKSGQDGDAVDALDVLAKGIRSVADRIAEYGVNILIEFNWSPVVKSLRTASEIVRRSGAPNAGVLFDPAHYHCTPTKFDQLTPENVATIKHVHVNDMRDKPGELSNCNDDRELPGNGILDLSAIFGRIAELGYKGDFSIEMFSQTLWALPPAEAARQMYQSLLPLCE